MPIGGLREAVIRALLYVGIGARPSTSAASKRCGACAARTPMCRLSTSRRWCASSSSCCCIDAEAALAAIPAMLPDDTDARRRAFELIMAGVGRARRISARMISSAFKRVAQLFGIDGRLNGSGNFVDRTRTAIDVARESVVVVVSYGKATGIVGPAKQLCDLSMRRSACRPQAAAIEIRSLDRHGARQVAAAKTIVVHPCDETSLRGAIEAARSRPHHADPGRPRGQDQERCPRASDRHRQISRWSTSRTARQQPPRPSS